MDTREGPWVWFSLFTPQLVITSRNVGHKNASRLADMLSLRKEFAAGHAGE
jgi:hypothetical protein